jgi:hypothetical protein
MKCPECYSDFSRITPLLNPEDCLKKHNQYICSTCGRIVCIDLAGEMRARCFMPFKSLKIAILYLRPAEVLSAGTCAIYEFKSKKSGRLSFKIFPNESEKEKYLSNNSDKQLVSPQALYTSEHYLPVKNNQVKKLNAEEINRYLSEYQQDNEARLTLLRTGL